jgi:small subunit ribosomal protein S21
MPAEKCGTANKRRQLAHRGNPAVTAIDHTGFTPGGNDAKQLTRSGVAAVAHAHVLLRRTAPCKSSFATTIDQALRALKKKMQRGVFRERSCAPEKPRTASARRAEAVRRYRKLLRKRMERSTEPIGGAPSVPTGYSKTCTQTACPLSAANLQQDFSFRPGV